jgi:hypothetical protein
MKPRYQFLNASVSWVTGRKLYYFRECFGYGLLRVVDAEEFWAKP